MITEIEITSLKLVSRRFGELGMRKNITRREAAAYFRCEATLDRTVYKLEQKLLRKIDREKKKSEKKEKKPNKHLKFEWF